MGFFRTRKQPADIGLRNRLIEQGTNHVLTQHNEGHQAFGAFSPELTQNELDAAGLDGLTLLQSVGAALAKLEPPVAAHMYNVPTGRNTVTGAVIDTLALASVIAVGDIDMRIDAPPAEREEVYLTPGYEIQPAALGIVALLGIVAQARRDSTRQDQAPISLSLDPASVANPTGLLH